MLNALAGVYCLLNQLDENERHKIDSWTPTTHTQLIFSSLFFFSHRMTYRKFTPSKMQINIKREYDEVLNKKNCHKLKVGKKLEISKRDWKRVEKKFKPDFQNIWGKKIIITFFYLIFDEKKNFFPLLSSFDCSLSRLSACCNPGKSTTFKKWYQIMKINVWRKFSVYWKLISTFRVLCLFNKSNKLTKKTQQKKFRDNNFCCEFVYDDNHTDLQIKKYPTTKRKKNYMIKWLEIHESKPIATKIRSLPPYLHLLQLILYFFSRLFRISSTQRFGHPQCDFVFKFVRNEYRMLQKLVSNNTFYISFCSLRQFLFDKMVFVCLLLLFFLLLSISHSHHALFTCNGKINWENG